LVEYLSKITIEKIVAEKTALDFIDFNEFSEARSYLILIKRLLQWKIQKLKEK